MILADKIMEERKKLGLSQEELAEKLSVSRQSVSKWEGAQSVPDINRILQMAEIFGVSTDYLLRDEMEKKPEKEALCEEVKSDKKVRRVSMEEAYEFIAMKKRQAPQIAFGVSLCILSSVLLLVLSGLAESRMLGITEEMAGGIGVGVLLVLVAVAVFFFIKCGNEAKKFEFMEKEEIDTEYGVDGMAKEGREKFQPIYNRQTTVGVVLCILSCVPLLLASFFTEEDYVLTGMVGVLLVVIAIAVYRFVWAGTIKEGYDKLLQEGDYTIDKKKNATLLGRISGSYWMIAVAVYLGWSFWTGHWEYTWILWPVAGVLFAVVMNIAKIILKAED